MTLDADTWAWIRLISSVVIFLFFVAASSWMLWRYRRYM